MRIKTRQTCGVKMDNATLSDYSNEDFETKVNFSNYF